MNTGVWRDREQILDLISTHITLRPEMELLDVYKLLYQGVMGPEHMISTSGEFLQRLKAECEQLPTFGGELLYEPVRPDGALVRINLRPYLAGGGSLSLLADICLKTARQTWGSTGDLQQAWQTFEDLALKRELGAWKLGELRVFKEQLVKEDWTPVHHSARYRSAYRPAYRLGSHT